MTLHTVPFEHRYAAHCESGVTSTLLNHHGIQISEAMALGLSSSLAFAYVPLIKLTGFPLISYRMPPKSILRGIMRPLQARFKFETFRRPEEGKARLDQLLDEGKVVGLQTSVYWLPYFPEGMRFHFNAHNLLVYGKDGDDYLISDPVAETPQRCASADLQKARFARGALAPKGLLYWPLSIGKQAIDPKDVLRAIRKTVRIMLGPIPIVGVRGMRMLANRVEKLPLTEYGLHYVGHIVRMQEEIGTGGGGFRFMYAAFLQEAALLTSRPALSGLAERMNEIGDEWRQFALKAARMIKGREPFDPKILANMLRQVAELERVFFGDLKQAVA